MDTAVSKLRGLVEALYIQTANGRLSWELGPGAGTVSTKIKNIRVDIDEEPGSNFENDVRITLYNRQGDQVDTFTDTAFNGLRSSIVGNRTYYTVMADILNMARRKISGADDLIEELLNELGGQPTND